MKDSIDVVESIAEMLTSQTAPSAEELDSMQFPDAYTLHRGMQRLKKPDLERIFVNRALRLDRIEYVGFDMDYTIANYTEEYERLCYGMIIDRLVEKMGYPSEIRELQYDSMFSIRGLFIDVEFGNLLKVDAYGIIMRCVHGRRVIPKDEVMNRYGSMKIMNEQIGRRFYLLNTLFSIPEACVFANLVEHFEMQGNPNSEKEGLPCLISMKCSGDWSEDDVSRMSEEGTCEAKHKNVMSRNGDDKAVDLYYKNLWTDVHQAMDSIHYDNSCKEQTLKDLPKYVKRSDQLSRLLKRLHSANKKVFLLTNSPWDYANRMMTYLLEGFDPNYRVWRDYWDIVIVSASKPEFFGAGSTLRKIDPITGKLSLGRTSSYFESGSVYHGGNLSIMEDMAGIKVGDTVLYIGDHVFSDVRMSRKRRGWRTMLIIPELERELKISASPSAQNLFNRLYSLQSAKALTYLKSDAESTEPPNVELLQSMISKTVALKDAQYNPFFGSMFTSGLKQSFFTQQMLRYACIYSTHFSNLLNYPMFYSFTADISPLPHETFDLSNSEAPTSHDAPRASRA
ncbi:cytosolic purine 5'-nucleotidase-like [Schistocerca gregaria]|uniref:cytosolic purine 5'-nucleotidase-like n=1 Tax=Schistocerca gregaria TaxID=7010 RepID=UPI00211E107D|nr:cytosolic purine 5'-nucleotidase-like [Schistocerca gregaria]